MNHRLKAALLAISSLLSLSLATWLFPWESTAQLDTAPMSQPFQPVKSETLCNNRKRTEWRQAQTIEGIKIEASPLCEPDNPYDIAAFVKGVNNISMRTLMQTQLAQDALTKGKDLDGDGDPDEIHIKLEVIELNGSSPDGDFLYPTYTVAPGIQPGLWVFAPKTRGMSIQHLYVKEAQRLLRAPSPVIRIEQGDTVQITLENTHYFPHSIHLHGVDHPWQDAAGEANDGVHLTGETMTLPGKTKTYTLTPRHAGTMFYHCHVQTDKHLMMGLNGMLVVEENRPDNWLQTFNVGAGQVRHPSVAVQEQYDQEYDLHYQAVDKTLAETLQAANDPRLIARAMNRDYNMTEHSEDYFLLNGHAFPYTLRDALVIVKPDERIKLRVANAQRSSMALHLHGHKTTVTAYDGVELPANQQITRDVFDLAPAQRLDLRLQTTDDGLHSFGSGVWLFHDHVETGITSDGISPGGNVSLLIDQSLLNADGFPSIGETALHTLFSEQYYAREIPIWQGLNEPTLGEVSASPPDRLKLVLSGILIGLGLGLFWLAYRVNRIERSQSE